MLEREELYLFCHKTYPPPNKLDLFGLCLYLVHLVLCSVKLEIMNYFYIFCHFLSIISFRKAQERVQEVERAVPCIPFSV